MPNAILEWPTAAPADADLTEVDWSSQTPWLGGIAEIVEWGQSDLNVVIIDGTPTIVLPAAPDLILTWQGPPGADGATGPPGPQGPPGPSGGTPFVFVQSSPSAMWHIVHGAGSQPNVVVLRADGQTIGAFGAIYSLDANTVDLYFGQPIAGKATLNY